MQASFRLSRSAAVADSPIVPAPAASAAVNESQSHTAEPDGKDPQRQIALDSSVYKEAPLSVTNEKGGNLMLARILFNLATERRDPGPRPLCSRP